MLGLRFGFVLSVVLALPSLCHGDTTLTFLDSTEGVQTSINGQKPADCGFHTEFCRFDFPVLPTFTHTLAFNIYDPSGVTLSDTLLVTASRLNFDINSTFQSDTESGLPLVPFAGGISIVEDGTVQTATTIPLETGRNFIVQFQSDLDPVPEPRWGVLLTLGVLGLVSRLTSQAYDGYNNNRKRSSSRQAL